MRPLTVLIGILMGSAASITFGLGTTLIVHMVLAARHPDMLDQFTLPQLFSSLLVFGLLTAASAGSFVGQAKGRSWRVWAHGVTFICLAGAVLMYWPHRT